MFTGIIKELGVVHSIDRAGALYRLSISAKTIFTDAAIGGSVSVNGVCLTLVEKNEAMRAAGHSNFHSSAGEISPKRSVYYGANAKEDNGILCFDVMEETIRKSDLMGLKKGGIVNLEPALTAVGSLGGHFVLGHIDCVGTIHSVKNSAREYAIKIDFPKEFTNLIVPKGSIAIDGVSLTIGEAKEDSLRVYLIPHTLNTTNLGLKKAGDAVNLEFDIIGKYVERMEKRNSSSRITDGFLRAKGF